MSNMNNYIFIFDFDRTISTNDVVADLIELGGFSGWNEMEEQANRGEITPKQAMDWDYGDIIVSKEEYFATIAQLMDLDEGAHDLFQWLSSSKNPVYIISDGMIEVIEYAFNDLGLGDGLDYIIDAHEAIWEDNTMVGFTQANEPCEHECANCKISKVQKLKDRYSDKHLVYVGDGYSDYLPAPLADFIFARENFPLSNYLAERGITHFTFKTLSHVRNKMIEVIF